MTLDTNPVQIARSGRAKAHAPARPSTASKVKDGATTKHSAERHQPTPPAARLRTRPHFTRQRPNTRCTTALRQPVPRPLPPARPAYPCCARLPGPRRVTPAYCGRSPRACRIAHACLAYATWRACLSRMHRSQSGSRAFTLRGLGPGAPAWDGPCCTRLSRAPPASRMLGLVPLRGAGLCSAACVADAADVQCRACLPRACRLRACSGCVGPAGTAPLAQACAVRLCFVHVWLAQARVGCVCLGRAVLHSPVSRTPASRLLGLVRLRGRASVPHACVPDAADARCRACLPRACLPRACAGCVGLPERPPVAHACAVRLCFVHV
ncbi:hypothetical protein FHU30_004167 [Actinomadura rupiterrae]|nr:hypothetical protein [Actinomadura rupiterrae]